MRHLARVAVWWLSLTGLLAPITGFGQAPAVRPVLDPWLTCIECVDGELNRVTRFAAGYPSLIDTLCTDLFQGPSPDRRANLIVALDSSYSRLVALHHHDSLIAPPAWSRDDFIRHYLGYELEIYRGRAALALAAIGGRRAMAVLDSALLVPSDSFPPHVLRRIRVARDSIRP